MSLLTDIIDMHDADRIGGEDLLQLASSLGALIARVATVAAAQGMTSDEWAAAVGLEAARLDAWRKATDAAEDKALRGG